MGACRSNVAASDVKQSVFNKITCSTGHMCMYIQPKFTGRKSQRNTKVRYVYLCVSHMKDYLEKIITEKLTFTKANCVAVLYFASIFVWNTALALQLFVLCDYLEA